MSISSFLLGSPGGLDKRQRGRLEDIYNQYSSDTVPQSYIDYIRGQVEPEYQRERTAIGNEYAGSDAPIASGGRTQALIGLANQEAQTIGGLTQNEIQRRRALRMQALQYLSQPRQPTQGLLGAAGAGAGMALPYLLQKRPNYGNMPDYGIENPYGF